MTYVLDASCMTRDGLHDYLQDCLPLPDYYGRNLDALFDCLTELSEVCICIVNTTAAGDAFPIVQRVFLDAAEENAALTLELMD